MGRGGKDLGEGSRVNTGAGRVWGPMRLPMDRGFSDGQARLVKFNLTIAILTFS